MGWEPLISSQFVRVQLTTSTCDWHLKWGQTCTQSGTEPHAVGSDVSPRQVGDLHRSESRSEVFQVEQTQEGREAFFPTQEGPARLSTPAADHASRLRKHGCPSPEQGVGSRGLLEATLPSGAHGRSPGRVIPHTWCPWTPLSPSPPCSCSCICACIRAIISCMRRSCGCKRDV